MNRKPTQRKTQLRFKVMAEAFLRPHWQVRWPEYHKAPAMLGLNGQRPRRGHMSGFIVRDGQKYVSRPECLALALPRRSNSGGRTSAACQAFTRAVARKNLLYADEVLDTTRKNLAGLAVNPDRVSVSPIVS